MKNYEFENADAVLDSSDGSLRTRSGDLVDLRPQSRDVLRLLAATPNRTISKEEFSRVVWDGRQVSEDSLVQCIAEIRTAIGDRDRAIIQTVPRKGYRFEPKESVSPHRFNRAFLAAGLAVLVAALGWLMLPRPSPELPIVAVLPLDDLSAAPNRDYLNDALSEGIITELARFPQFRVVARNSSFQFRDTPTDVREIGRVLGAGYVVEGSQQYDGENLKVTLQLIETDTGTHLFSDQYDRNLHDLFAVQDDIVRHVASVVGQSILTDMPQRATPRDVDSRLRGLQARRIMSQLNYENWQKAMALEETSIREEPESAWGYIGKSLMLGAAAALGWREPREAVLQEATELAETALKIDPQNYMSHYTLARVLSRREDHAESLLHFQRAAELNPSDSLILIGMSVPLLYSGRTDEALTALDQAAAVDPLHGDWLRWQLGRAYWQKGNCDKGLEAMQSMASPPTASNKTLAALLVCLDRAQEAEAAMAAFLESNPAHSLEKESRTEPQDWQPDGTADRWLDDLKTAGMP